MKSKIHIGTSGWHYDDWKGNFYPNSLPSSKMLNFYASHFSTVELNNSFYQLPEKDTIHNWCDAVPQDFVFTVKASRYITHMKKLTDTQNAGTKLIDRLSAFKDHLGPILFQLPPNWRCNPDRLKHFLASLPSKYQYAFEFRDSSWFDDQIYRCLEDANAAFCIYDLAGKQSPRVLTTSFTYIRLHGPKKAYKGSYSQKSLSGWAGAVTTWSNQVKEIFFFFDNDAEGHAAKNAMSFKNMIQSSQ